MIDVVEEKNPFLGRALNKWWDVILAINQGLQDLDVVNMDCFKKSHKHLIGFNSSLLLCI